MIETVAPGLRLPRRQMISLPIVHCPVEGRAETIFAFPLRPVDEDDVRGRVGALVMHGDPVGDRLARPRRMVPVPAWSPRDRWRSRPGWARARAGSAERAATGATAAVMEASGE